MKAIALVLLINMAYSLKLTKEVFSNTWMEDCTLTKDHEGCQKEKAMHAN